MGFRSKRYKKDSENVSTVDVFSISDGVKKIQGYASTKFDQSVELVMHLGIDPKHADQMVRGSIALPNGIGKSRNVIAFCEDSEVEAAIAAGASEAGNDDLVAKVADGWMDFDVAISSPRLMGKVGKLGRVLGPQGKMPSPKNGTVTADVVTAVAEFAAGKVEFRNDAGGNVHAIVGKVSFDSAKLVENIDTFITHIKHARPSTVKGIYIKKVAMSATMSPSVLLDVNG